jgi:hypothetical protein
MAEPEQAAQLAPFADELAQSVKQTRKNIKELAHRAEAISVINPFSLLTIHRIGRERKALEDQFLNAGDSAIGISTAPLTGVGNTMSGLMAMRSGHSIMHLLLLQTAWKGQRRCQDSAGTAPVSRTAPVSDSAGVRSPFLAP